MNEYLNSSITYKEKTGCGNFYVTITEDKKIFTYMGKAGGCAFAQSQALSFIINYALENNLDPLEISKRIKDIQCQMGENNCINAIANTIEKNYKEKNNE